MRAEDLAAASGAANSDADDGDEDGDDAAEGEGGGEEEGEGEEGGDMQLAWEMLEVARTIYAKSGDAGVRALGLAGALLLSPPRHACAHACLSGLVSPGWRARALSHEQWAICKGHLRNAVNRGRYKL